MASGLQLLLVDDSLEDQETYLRFLSEVGYGPDNVTTAFTGEEALETFRSNPPDCLILDYRLPDLNALEFLKRLSNVSHQPPVAVVVLTGQGSEKVAAETMKLGAHDYLVKSDVTASTLLEAILSSIARQQREIGIRQRTSSMSTFVDAIVHDLRTPLTSLGLNVDMLKEAHEHENADEIHACVDGIVESYDALRSLLESVHRLVVSEGAVFDSVYFELNTAVKSSLRSLRAELEKRQVEVVVHPLPSVVSDEPVVAEVIQNILSNAIDHSGEHNPTITVQAVVDRQHTDLVMAGLVVHDNGRGFSEEALVSMFDPLWRDKRSRVTRNSGNPNHLGLGLSICVRLLEKLGGHIWADNAPEGGGRVFITLPTRDSENWTTISNAIVLRSQ